MYVSYNVCRMGNFSNAASYSVCWSWNASNAALKASTDVNYGMCWPCNIKICCMDYCSCCSCSKTSILDGDITLLDRQRPHAESDGVSFFFALRVCGSSLVLQTCGSLLIWSNASACSMYVSYNVCRMGNFSNAASYSVCWSWNASNAALKASTDVNYGMCWPCNIKICCMDYCSCCSCSKTSILDGDITLLDRQRPHAESDGVSFFFALRMCGSSLVLQTVWLPPYLVKR